MRYRFTIAILITLFAATVCVADDEDPYLWLEEVESEKALTWAKERSDADTEVLKAVPEYAEIHARLLEIYNSRDRIPAPGFRGAWIYNFWQDADHVRGVWRRTFLDEFVKNQPAWEIVLDLDALAEAEGENWVWSEVNCLGPDYRHCMIGLSRGGADATVVREFDTVSKEFVDGGFTVPEAKHQIDWMDENTLWVATDFGEGSLTTSGYPRIAKQWQRGTPLNEATTVFEASIDDVFAFAYSSHTPEARYDLVNLTPEFFRGTSYLRLGGRLVKIDIPEDAQMQGFFKNHMLVSLRTDWTVAGATYPQDALLAIGLDDFLKGNRDFEVLFEPSERVALDQVQSTRNHLVYTTLDNVHSRLYRLAPEENGWTKEEIELPGIGTVRLNQRGSSDSFFSDSTDDFFFTYTDFVTPTSLYLVGNEGETKRVKSSPEWFDATGMSVAQYQATSKDGTEIPYFVFMPKGFLADGVNPTVIYAYGGFEVSRLPRYSGADGCVMGFPRWCLRARQHPRRWRVRAQVAPGRNAGKTSKQFRRFDRGRRGPDRAQDHVA